MKTNSKKKLWGIVASASIASIAAIATVSTLLISTKCNASVNSIQQSNLSKTTPDLSSMYKDLEVDDSGKVNLSNGLYSKKTEGTFEAENGPLYDSSPLSNTTSISNPQVVFKMASGLEILLSIKNLNGKQTLLAQNYQTLEPIQFFDSTNSNSRWAYQLETSNFEGLLPLSGTDYFSLFVQKDAKSYLYSFKYDTSSNKIEFEENSIFQLPLENAFNDFTNNLKDYYINEFNVSYSYEWKKGYSFLNIKDPSKTYILETYINQPNHSLNNRNYISYDMKIPQNTESQIFSSIFQIGPNTGLRFGDFLVKFNNLSKKLIVDVISSNEQGDGWDSEPVNGILKVSKKLESWPLPNSYEIDLSSDDIMSINPISTKPMIFGFSDDSKKRIAMFLNMTDTSNNKKVLVLLFDITYDNSIVDTPNEMCKSTKITASDYKIYETNNQGLNSVLWTGNQVLLNTGSDQNDSNPTKFTGNQSIFSIESNNWTDSNIKSVLPKNKMNSEQTSTSSNPLFTVGPSYFDAKYDSSQQSSKTPIIIQSEIGSSSSQVFDNTNSNLQYATITKLKSDLYLVVRSFKNITSKEEFLSSIKVAIGPDHSKDSENPIVDALLNPVAGSHILFENPHDDGSKKTVDVYVDKYCDASGVQIKKYKLGTVEVHTIFNWDEVKTDKVGQIIKYDETDFTNIFHNTISIYKKVWENEACIEQFKIDLQTYLNKHVNDYIKLNIVSGSPSLKLNSLLLDSSTGLYAANVTISWTSGQTYTENNFLKFSLKDLNPNDLIKGNVGQLINTSNPLFNQIFIDPIYDLVNTWEDPAIKSSITEKIATYLEQHKETYFIIPDKLELSISNVILEKKQSVENQYEVKVDLSWTTDNSNSSGKKIVITEKQSVLFATFQPKSFEINPSLPIKNLSTNSVEFQEMFKNIAIFKYKQVWANEVAQTKIKEYIKVYFEAHLKDYSISNIPGTELRVKNVNLSFDDPRLDVKTSIELEWYIPSSNPSGQEIILKTQSYEYYSFTLDQIVYSQIINSSAIGQTIGSQDSIFNDIFDITNNPKFKYAKVWDETSLKSTIEKKVKDYISDNISKYFNSYDSVEVSINSVSLVSNSETKYSVTVDASWSAVAKGDSLSIPSVLLGQHEIPNFINFTLENPDTSNVTTSNIGETIKGSSDQFDQIFSDKKFYYVDYWKDSANNDTIKDTLKLYIDKNISTYINKDFDGKPRVKTINISPVTNSLIPNMYKIDVTIEWVISSNPEIVIAEKPIENFMNFILSPSEAEFTKLVANSWIPSEGTWVDWTKTAIAKTLNLPQFKSLLPDSLQDSSITSDMIEAKNGTNSFPKPQNNKVTVSNIGISGLKPIFNFFVSNPMSFDITGKYHDTTWTQKDLLIDANEMSRDEFNKLFSVKTSMFGIDWERNGDQYGGNNPDISSHFKVAIQNVISNDDKNNIISNPANINGITTDVSLAEFNYSGSNLANIRIGVNNYFRDYRFVNDETQPLTTIWTLELKPDPNMEKFSKQLSEGARDIFIKIDGSQSNKIKAIKTYIIGFLNDLKTNNEIPYTYSPEGEFTEENTKIDLKINDVDYTVNVSISPGLDENEQPAFQMEKINFKFSADPKELGIDVAEYWKIALIISAIILVIILVIVIIWTINKKIKPKKQKTSEVNVNLIDPLDEVL